jgi:predicted nucleic acid-binding protein
LPFYPIKQEADSRFAVFGWEIDCVLAILVSFVKRKVRAGESDTINLAVERSRQRLALLIDCELDAR